MITFASTVGLETVLMKKPLITINLTGQDNPIPLYKYGVALEITKEENILKGVENILNSKNLRSEMEKNSREYFGNILTGKAAYNIVQLILQILKKSEIKI
ncbi:MAG: hypothetical protein HYU63_08225 [Armatimonadetes bacterium]|nr:hypothetical protein [Armatimonadota bacterium]